MEAVTSDENIYLNLCKKYLIVFLLATFADWLQGPYLYKLYVNYGYGTYDISLLYVVGFASSTIFGIGIGHLGDLFGQKILCILYSFLYSLSCIFKLSNNFWMLVIGRIFGGISTSILFSTFESWYVSQHLFKFRLDKEWISRTLTKFTNFGPIAPFLLALPILIISGYMCATLWEESEKINVNIKKYTWMNVLKLLFMKKNRILLHLGIIQSLFESVMYTFVFLWTPVLSPIHPSLGFVFSSFMLCIMFGSSLDSVLLSKYHIPCETLLKASIVLSLCSMLGCSFGTYVQMQSLRETFGTYICLVAFLCYEVAIGMYYPAIGYLRGIVLPESHRISITNWFRFPTNLLTCIVLFYIRLKAPYNYEIFSIGIIGLTIAAASYIRFAKLYSRDLKYHRYVTMYSDASDVFFF